MMAVNRSIIKYLDKNPKVSPQAFIAPQALVIGDVSIGSQSSIWFNTVLRGDVHKIQVGERTNIQDNSVVHVSQGIAPTYIGNDVTIGHGAIIHACTIEDECLIGMGAIILDLAVISKGCIVGAGALVTQKKVFPERSMIMGSPAKAVRTVTDQEFARIQASARSYASLSKSYQNP